MFSLMCERFLFKKTIVKKDKNNSLEDVLFDVKR